MICTDKELREIEKRAVEAFAEELKKRAFQGYQVGMYIVTTEMIDELLKEFL